MNTNFEDVGEFHRQFGLDEVLSKGVGPRNVPPDLAAFRLKFLQEELDEFEDATSVGDMPKAFDALIDLVYVALGTAHLYGFPWKEGWRRVQAANMSKVRVERADQSKRGSAYDVVKPEGWKPPDIDGLLSSLGWMPGETKKRVRPSREERYWNLAKHVATWSKDPSTKVGSVLVGSDPRKIAVGYNGFPPGIIDSEERLNDRAVKLKFTQHAERNVLDNAEFDAKGGTIYSTQIPCSECAKSIISRGIAKVICPPRPTKEPWSSDADYTLVMFAEAGIVLQEIA